MAISNSEVLTEMLHHTGTKLDYKIKPVKNEDEMYQLIPNNSLSPGNYLLYWYHPWQASRITLFNIK